MAAEITTKRILREKKKKTKEEREREKKKNNDPRESPEI